MATEHTQQLVQDFLANLTNRNLDKLTLLFAEKLDWYIPGNETLAPWTGRRQTREDVKNFYELLWSQTEPLAVQMDLLLVEDSQAVITGDFSTRMLETDQIVNSLFCIRLSIKDDQIVWYRLLEDSYAVSQALQKT
ncbi:nuclear transport factor 2 family protein [Cytophagaceae bacterium DM2B3-1]|uniref:Nuclear transport factor 2 family protein n=1 Tax=Xanthocytophaga flava TaxID=3048013 RepID=A0ABT7CHB0_9BACT|nr:nuclear transport factor 2 family protein [Xanthocytophaga flavus]MDJ1470724.1 nuclear transport factor 2 family protein [Xanthocytophaga flavus]MDJ1493123.1 nuclear transport factor 2 family protein [Xanthocytophaga flavus]